MICKCNNLIQPLSINSNDFLKSYIISNSNNTNRDNLVTICKDDPFEIKNNTSILQNDGVIYPEKHNSQDYITTRIPSFLLYLGFNEYSSNIQACTKINDHFSNLLTPHLSINVITVLPKLWR